MTGKLDRFEAELAAVRPRALPMSLVERIEADLAAGPEPSRWPDRFLLSAIASGAIAACVIVAVLLKPSSPAFPSPPPVLATMPPAGSGLPRAGDFSLAVARSDAAASLGS
jgi:hypothetical protein